MGFERYERADGRTDDEPQVSLRASGSIGLNSAAVDAYFADADYAALYYDAESERVGIEPAADDDGGEYTLQRGEAPTHGGTLYATGFLREYDLLAGRTTTYPAGWDDDAGLVAVDLSDPVESDTSDGGDETGRPDPSETHATVSWVDDVSGADNVLLTAPESTDDRVACAALLGIGDPGRTGLVVVTGERSADEWLADFDAHAAERPARLAVIDVDPPADAARTTTRGDGVTVSVVPGAGDLTGIGIPLADHGTRLRDDVETLVVCVDSVSDLLADGTVAETTDFLGVLAGKIGDWATTSTDVRAHYHLDADAHRPDTVDAVADVVDVSVGLDDEGEVEGIRR